MASRLRTYCPHCGRLVEKGQRCECRPERDERARTKRRKVQEPWRKAYTSADYRQSRQEAISRALGRCEVCGAAVAYYNGAEWITGPLGGDVHHIIPLAEGGGNDPSNLVLLCRSCHAKQDADRRKRR